MDTRAENPELLTIPEGSTYTRLKPSTLRAWILRRKIAYVKLGGRVFLRRGDLERLIAQSVVPAKADGEFSPALALE